VVLPAGVVAIASTAITVVAAVTIVPVVSTVIAAITATVAVAAVVKPPRLVTAIAAAVAIEVSLRENVIFLPLCPVPGSSCCRLFAGDEGHSTLLGLNPF
jgi:hypothetical protein